MKATITLLLILSITFGLKLHHDVGVMHAGVTFEEPWKNIDGALKWISVGADGRVWGVNSADQIWTRAGVDGTWQLIDGALKQIAVGVDGRVWGVNSADQIWTRPGVDGAWQLIDGGLKNIAVGVDGRVWGVNSAD